MKKIAKEMRAELKVANREIRENNKQLKAMIAAIAKTLGKIMGDDSPVPDFRDKCLAHTRQYAEQYVYGAITKKEMKEKYRKFHNALTMVVLKNLWDDPRFEPFREALMKYTYHSIRRNAILNGETVFVSK